MISSGISKCRRDSARTESTLFLLFVCIGLVLTFSITGCPGLGDDDDDSGDGTTPTWENDVKDILVPKCATCHTNPPSGNAPEGFRLDKYNQAEGDDNWEGAFEKRDRILVRTVQLLDMPPLSPLPSSERDIIRAWVEGGAPR